MKLSIQYHGASMWLTLVGYPQLQLYLFLPRLHLAEARGWTPHVPGIDGVRGWLTVDYELMLSHCCACSHCWS